jgi:undecaprenyl diphosphate synthase
MKQLPELNVLPQHVAIIMDGNGRWARKHHLPRQEGHKEGATRAQQIVETFIEYTVPYLTLYAFSTENWNRPRIEVEGLFRLMEDRLDEGIRFALKKGVKVRHFGKLDKLPPKVQQKIKEAVALTQNNNAITLGFAFNYGGRDELIEATQRILKSGIKPEDITESVIKQHLYTSGIPDPDLIIRTGGEKRLSNFLLWQAAYAEIYLTPVLWPDFDGDQVKKAIIDYSKRQRRFGRLKER